MDNSFFKIYRSLLDDPLWLGEPFTYGQAWVDLIGRANFADKDNFYRGRFQRIGRGQIATSQQELADRWKWSRHKVNTFLRNLERAAMVTTKTTTNGTTITIEKYAFYQDTRTAKSTTKGQQKDRARTSEGHQKDISGTQNKKEKKERKKEGIYIPSRADIAAYIAKEGLETDPDEVFDYYQGLGWEINGKAIKDWQAVVRRWKTYDKPEQKTSKAEQDAEVKRLLDIMERGGNIYDTTGSS